LNVAEARRVESLAWKRVAVHPAVFLIAGALAVRILCLLAQGPNLIDQDGANFARTAQSLHAGAGYIGMRGALNLVHSPLYPVLIDGLLSFGIDPERAGLAISLCAGSLLAALVFIVAQMLNGRRAAIVAGAIIAVHPFLIALSSQVLADELTMLLSFCGIAALLRSFERPWYGFACGVAFGLAYLARPEGFWQGMLALTIVIIAAFVRRDGVRPAIVRALGIVLPLALCVIPYAIFLSGATGHARVEAKSAVNYLLGTRIAAGMSYEEAANGLGPDLREDGPELGIGFFVTHPGIADPTLSQRVHFAFSVFVPQMKALLRVLVSRAFGTPLLLLLAAAGLLSGPWNRRRAGYEAILIAFAGLDVAALCSLNHLWPRYALPVVPFLAIWAGKAVAQLLEVEKLRRPALAVATLLLCLSAVFAAVQMRHEAVAPQAMHAAAAYIAASPQERRPLVMSVTMLVPFYAGATAQPIPYSSSRVAIAYIAKKSPQYLVLESSQVQARPYLRDWLANGVPDARAHRVYSSSSVREGEIIVYRWQPQS
jgi:4-amino-4-deoxy-L-arabinose transferase-like glycosyltransferase